MNWINFTGLCLAAGFILTVFYYGLKSIRITDQELQFFDWFAAVKEMAPLYNIPDEVIIRFSEQEWYLWWEAGLTPEEAIKEYLNY